MWLNFLKKRKKNWHCATPVANVFCAMEGVQQTLSLGAVYHQSFSEALTSSVVLTAQLTAGTSSLQQC